MSTTYQSIIKDKIEFLIIDKSDSEYITVKATCQKTGIKEVDLYKKVGSKRYSIHSVINGLRQRIISMRAFKNEYE